MLVNTTPEYDPDLASEAKLKRHPCSSQQRSWFSKPANLDPPQKCNHFFLWQVSTQTKCFMKIHSLLC